MEAKIWNKKGWIKEINPRILYNTYSKILQKCGFVLLNFQQHHFKPQGYTALWLLGESHFALHTFPEKNKTYYELSSCNKEQYIKFIEFIKTSTFTNKMQIIEGSVNDYEAGEIEKPELLKIISENI